MINRDFKNRTRIIIGAIRNGVVLHLRVVTDDKGSLYLVEQEDIFTPFLTYDEAFNHMAGV